MNCKTPLYCVVMLAFILPILGCAATATTSAPSAPVPPTVTPASASPIAGTWTAAAETFRFEFTVDPGGQSITGAIYEFESLVCVDMFLTGRARTKAGSGWKIEGQQFKIDDTFSVPLAEGSNSSVHVVITGKLDPTGGRATGAWEVEADMLPCQKGDWKAVPGSLP